VDDKARREKSWRKTFGRGHHETFSRRTGTIAAAKGKRGMKLKQNVREVDGNLKENEKKV